MEKQTKILLGLAAASVVAYLILKPKKAVASQSTPTQVRPDLVADHQPKNVKVDVPFNIDCQCFRAPCNCGGGGVVLDTFMSNQVYES